MNLPTSIGAAAALYSGTFVVGALLHAGVRIPLGFTVLAEPAILPAMIVESLAALALGIGAYAVLTARTWAWLAALAAHTFALAGVLLGMAAITAGRGPRSPLNDAYHRAMVILLLGSLLVLLTPAGRAALGRATRGSLRSSG